MSNRKTTLRVVGLSRFDQLISEAVKNDRRKIRDERILLQLTGWYEEFNDASGSFDETALDTKLFVEHLVVAIYLVTVKLVVKEKSFGSALPHVQHSLNKELMKSKSFLTNGCSSFDLDFGVNFL